MEIADKNADEIEYAKLSFKYQRLVRNERNENDITSSVHENWKKRNNKQINSMFGIKKLEKEKINNVED